MNQRKKIQASGASYLKYAGIAIQMLVIILLFTYGGIKLDKYVSLNIPIFTVLFSLIGVVLGIYTSVKDFFKKNSKK
ncbi:MAG: AtpZ/AtpI family protein [Bacteroidales bacterium]|nr:AtpZ/AtpI family protein [Bacteroidales bacterium]